MTNIFNTMVVQRMDKTHSRIGNTVVSYSVSESAGMMETRARDNSRTPYESAGMIESDQMRVVTPLGLWLERSDSNYRAPLWGTMFMGINLSQSDDDVARQHWRSRVGHRDNVTDAVNLSRQIKSNVKKEINTNSKSKRVVVFAKTIIVVKAFVWTRLDFEVLLYMLLPSPLHHITLC